MPPVEHGPSRIAGMGVFLGEKVRAGATVLQQDGIGELNHSCEPSLGWSGQGVLVALHDLAAGDELTIDYSTVIDDPAYVLWCHCETYRCRQVIEGTDWAIPQLQLRYAGHWSPAIQQRIDAAR